MNPRPRRLPLGSDQWRFLGPGLLWIALCSNLATGRESEEEQAHFAAGLISLTEASETRLQSLKAMGLGTVVFNLTGPDASMKLAIRRATAMAKKVGLSFAYWVEVARCEELANQHPEWMASLQTHDEWRRLFPDPPQPTADEVAKTYPWVPILSREPFRAQRERVLELLAGLPKPEQIFLNDLQGAPSACGCGNSFCRWTSDYGKRRTTIPLGDDAAALFLTAVKTAMPESEVIPVWTTECEEHDGHPDGLCAGVGCFQGICWKAYTRQLMPVAAMSRRIGVLVPYKEFERDIPHYGEAKASWIRFAIESFEKMPPRHHGEAIEASRVIAVIQGWDVTAEELAAQRAVAREAGSLGLVIAFDQIEQGWTPVVRPWKSSSAR